MKLSTKMLPMLAVLFFMTSCQKEEPVSSDPVVVQDSEPEGREFSEDEHLAMDVSDQWTIEQVGEIEYRNKLTKRTYGADIVVSFGTPVTAHWYLWTGSSWTFDGTTTAADVGWFMSTGNVHCSGKQSWQIVIPGSGCQNVTLTYRDFQNNVIDVDSYSWCKGGSQYSIYGNRIKVEPDGYFGGTYEGAMVMGACSGGVCGGC